MSSNVPARLVRRLSDEKAIEAGCYFLKEDAERAKSFIETYCRHFKSTFAVKSGDPFRLHKWQWEDIVEPLYGWKWPDGTRRFREVYCSAAKKNGKSTLEAALGCYHFFVDGEAYGEIVSVARDRKQAGITFDEASRVILGHEDLKPLAKIRQSVKKMENLADGSVWTVCPQNPQAMHGINASCLLIDEFHVVSDKLFEVIKYATAARRQPVTFKFSTAGNDTQSICYDLHCHARSVLANEVVDLRMLPVIYESMPGDDPHDPETWKKANPSYGVTVTEDTIRQMAEEAKRSPRDMQTFLNLICNQFCKMSGAVDLQKYQACYEKFSEDDLKGEECIVALDLASVSDTCSVVAYFPRSHRFLPYFWCPAEEIQSRERSNKQKYRQWVKQGSMFSLPGWSTSYEPIFEKIKELARTFRVKLVLVDPWGAKEIHQWMKAAGLNVKGFSQGFASMNDGTKKFLAMVGDKKLRHNGNPVMEWMVGNMVVVKDSGDRYRPHKTSSKDKIDGVVALVMAIGGSLDVISVYEDRGLRVL